MKRIFSLLFVAILPAIVMSQAVIVFESKTHDFGTINEEDGRVSFDFKFENQGNAPLIISKVQASCGCTTPSWTKSPVEPGQKGTITVTYNPAGRPGNFTKSITVQSNADVERERLIIKGVVTPKPKAEPRPVYSAAVEDLCLNTRSVEFNNVEKGIVKEAGLKVKNASNSAVKLSFANLPAYVSVGFNGQSLAPNAEQELTFSFDSKKCPLWGPLSEDIYIVLNDKKVFSDTYKLTISANVVEDFSKMTLEQKRNAPILEMGSRSVHLGKLNGAVKREGDFFIRNVGKKALEIRRIINDNKDIALKQDHLTVRGGKTVGLKFAVYTQGLPPGKYKRAITLQTNDPENVYVVLSVEWEVL